MNQLENLAVQVTDLLLLDPKPAPDGLGSLKKRDHSFDAGSSVHVSSATKAVLFHGFHLKQLPPPSSDRFECSHVLARGNRDVRSHPGSKLCEHYSVYGIGLGVLAHRSSEVPGLLRVDHCDWKIRVGTGDQKRLLETASVLASDQGWLELFDVLLDPKAAPSGLGRLTNCLIPLTEFSNSRISPVGSANSP
jgi:hypothetical protein